jgi:hypothetical protein
MLTAGLSEPRDGKYSLFYSDSHREKKIVLFLPRLASKFVKSESTKIKYGV